jgi:hypothetical protein
MLQLTHIIKITSILLQLVHWNASDVILPEIMFTGTLEFTEEQKY